MLASCVNPGGSISLDLMDEAYSDPEDITSNGLPLALPELLSQSCLVPAISSYLRNDSGTDVLRAVMLENCYYYLFVYVTGNLCNQAFRVMPENFA